MTFDNQVLVNAEIAALRLELQNLELQYELLDNERIELLKIVSDFEYKHSVELGELILKILKLRKQIFKGDQPKYQEASNDYKQYKEQHNKEIAKVHFELTENENKELKTKFRKASLLCHPDKVSDEFKEAAKAIFIELKTAYEANDLKKVSEILMQLQLGKLFKSKSQTISEKDKILLVINDMKQKITQIEREIISIKETEVFKTITSISDLNKYFSETKRKLQQELINLEDSLKVKNA